MAFRKDIKIKGSNNIVVPGAYSRITALRFDHPYRMYVQVGVFEDELTANAIDTRDYTYSLLDVGGKSKISLGEAYKILKLEEEWIGSEDV